MKNFTRGGNFGRRDSGSRGGFGRNGSDRPAMHKATCAECGSSCEVPFKPMSGKPVYCSNCFGAKDESSSRSFRSRDERPSFGHSRNEHSNFEEKKMFRATCSECGSSCEVPFKPNSGKPVYCDECFGKTDNGSEKRNERPARAKSNDNTQFDILNEKLDKILKALNDNSPKGIIKDVKKDVKEIIENIGEEVEEAIAEPKKTAKKMVAKVEKVIKKVTSKKAAAPKKAVAKKAAPKKAKK